MANPFEIILEDILKEESRKNFVKILLGNEKIQFKELYSDFLKMKETTARHHLKLLENKRIVERVKEPGKKDIYLRIPPFLLERIRKFYDQHQSLAYIGFVGERDPGYQAKQAIERLKTIGFAFKAVYILTTKENAQKLKKDQSWNEIERNYRYTDLVTIPLIDFEETYTTINTILKKEIFNYSFICDVTGGTKIFTLALYTLAQKYGLRRFYLPEKEVDNIMELP